jgi:hypothetical protein
MTGTDSGAIARWDLTAPESLVLRDGPYWAKPAEVIKVAVLELVTRRVLRLVEVETRDRRGRRTTEMVIGVGGRPAPVEGPLASVAKIALEASATNYADGTVGVDIRSFAKTFVAKHGNNPHRFIQQSVRPALEARGLFTRRPGKLLRVFPFETWTRTPEGERARAKLVELTTTAERQVGEWSEREPWRLASFLAMAGGAALLVPSAYPMFDELARRLRDAAASGDDGAVVAILGTAVFPSQDAGSDRQGMDFGGLDLSELSWDFSGFAGLDGAFAGLDAGIDAGTAGADGSSAD